METVYVPGGLVYDPRSYRTYEEWKHNVRPHRCDSKHGSYRTYEEWKLR